MGSKNGRGGVRSIAKRQHFHMNFILRNFALNGWLWVVDKKTGRGREATTIDDCFVAKEIWSNEIEEMVGNQGIERRAQGQIRRVINGEAISDHQAISEYDIFWKLRHKFRREVLPPYKIMEGWSDRKHPEHDKITEWCNVNGKVYVRGDGTISGKDSLSQQIKSSIDINIAQYEKGVWVPHYHPGGNFISADCYQLPIMPISPYYVLVCTQRGKAEKGIVIEDDDEVEVFNNEAKKQCHEFWFYAKS